MQKLKVVKIGNSLGIILPKKSAERMRIGKGDELTCLDTTSGIELTPYDPGFEKKLVVARRVARRYRNALRELAK
jgi:putative addiction module antidote